MSWFAAEKGDPRKMVLAVGLPMTVSEFANDLRLGARKDFASHFVARAEGREAKADHYARALYGPTVACIDEVVSAVRGCNVEVVRGLDVAAPHRTDDLID